jgi:hypothetical protein
MVCRYLNRDVFEKAGTVNVEYDVRAIGAERGHDTPSMKMPGR